MSSNDDASSPLNPHKGRLTDAEKRQNHIASEKKRRDAIRAGFDKICDIVPDMKGQGRSEAIVLQATVAFMKEQVAKKEQLKKIAVDEKGWTEAQFERFYAAAEEQLKQEAREKARSGD